MVSAGVSNWLYENEVVINPMKIKNLTNRKMTPVALQKLNQLLLEVLEDLENSGRRRYVWNDLREALTVRLILPQYETRRCVRGSKDDKK